MYDDIPEGCKTCAGSLCGCSFDPEACSGYISIDDYTDMINDVKT